MKHLSKATLAVAGLTLGLGATAQAEVIDTFSRADGTDIGSSEVGGFNYVERHTSITGESGLRDVAQILDNRLLVTGFGSAEYNKTPGLVYVNGYDSADTAVSMTVEFDNQSNSPTSTSRAASSIGFLLRMDPAGSFTTTATSAYNGQLGVELLSNGGVLIRENRPTGLATIYSGNPFVDASNDWYYHPGWIPTSFGGASLDANANGIFEPGEAFDLSVSLEGNTVSMFINGELLVSGTTSFANGTGANGVGVYKNLISGSFENASNIYVDNLAVTPVPEPAAATLLAAGGLLALRRRR